MARQLPLPVDSVGVVSPAQIHTLLSGRVNCRE
jgi:hypothetical protein